MSSSFRLSLLWDVWEPKIKQNKIFLGFKDQEKISEAKTILYSYLKLPKLVLISTTSHIQPQHEFKMLMHLLKQ